MTLNQRWQASGLRRQAFGNALAAKWAAGPGATPTGADFYLLLRAAKDGRLPGTTAHPPSTAWLAGIESQAGE